MRFRIGPRSPSPTAGATSPRSFRSRALFYLLAGIAGAYLARYLVGRAEAALREAREQDLFGKYLLHEPIGVGGMGQVFRATYCPEGGFLRTVAVKRLRAAEISDARLQERLREEARLSAGLSHPNLVHVLDCGTFRGAFVMVMEYVDGVSLARLLRADAPLPLAAVAYLGAELAAALEYVHARRGGDGAPLRLVHGDVNPPNVLVSRLGEVKLGDFGVARTRADVPAGLFAGKVAYAAPEQLRGDALDARTDLYGLGVTLREALAGRDTPELAALVEELCAADAAHRPTSAASVRARLVALGGELAPHPMGETALAESVDRLDSEAKHARTPPMRPGRSK